MTTVSIHDTVKPYLLSIRCVTPGSGDPAYYELSLGGRIDLYIYPARLAELRDLISAALATEQKRVNCIADRDEAEEAKGYSEAL